jgi:predicted phage terminase large subunit-like protein
VASLLERLATVDLTREQRAALLEQFPMAAAALARRDWLTIRRPQQSPPDGAWTVWLIVTGRGWGKTRTAAEWSIRRSQEIIAQTGAPTRWALVAQTFTDGRDVMVEGESGLLRCIPPSLLRNGNIDDSWNRSLGEVMLENGSLFKIYTAERARRLRGPQFHGAWADELSSWQDAHKGPAQDTTWSNLMLGLRLPPDPRIVVTTTPKRNALTRALLDDALKQATACEEQGWYEEKDTLTGNIIRRESPMIRMTRGSTYDNLANLAPQFAAQVLAQYEGTRLGEQELYGKMLLAEGSLLRPEFFNILYERPPHGTPVRMWDLAATEPSDTNPNPDWTAGYLVAQTHDGYVILDGERFRRSPGKVEQRILEIARADGPEIPIWIEQEGGASGKSLIAHFQRLLDGKNRVHGYRPSGDKVTRASVLLAGPAEQGRVSIVYGPWTQAFLDECADFPDGDHDDQIDVVGAAIDVLQQSRPVDALYAPVSDSQPSAWRM